MSVFIIAEISANHNQNLDLALQTVQAAIDAGADAIKVQTFKPESMALDVDNAIFGPKTYGAWKGWRPWDLYKKAALPYEWHKPIQEMTLASGKEFFSSPFDTDAVTFLQDLGVSRYKIASFEINDIPLIYATAQTLKPLILSTGVATLKDIELALETCRAAGNNDITLLKCTSEYPSTVERADLSKMIDMRSRFSVNVGLSDHTSGFIVAAAATALGATVIEKHFILDRTHGGLDSAFSMEPHEFSQMVSVVRDTELTLGEVNYDVSIQDQRRKRSLFVIQPIKAGERFSPENLRSLRPNIGLQPKRLSEVLGARATRDLQLGHPLTEDDFVI